jgi:hypothetical protein
MFFSSSNHVRTLQKGITEGTSNDVQGRVLAPPWNFTEQRTKSKNKYYIKNKTKSAISQASAAVYLNSVVFGDVTPR